ncbi:hypothetical protein J6590_072483 [Homalodisca vitripennis]|nr:hypothetical protein J6590_072483 [Homalodisca vitripennis]
MERFGIGAVRRAGGGNIKNRNNKGEAGRGGHTNPYRTSPLPTAKTSNTIDLNQRNRQNYKCIKSTTFKPTNPKVLPLSTPGKTSSEVIFKATDYNKEFPPLKKMKEIEQPKAYTHHTTSICVQSNPNPKQTKPHGDNKYK